jgi:hypothetical protein
MKKQNGTKIMGVFIELIPCPKYLNKKGKR